jgi:hypothetical protein
MFVRYSGKDCPCSKPQLVYNTGSSGTVAAAAASAVDKSQLAFAFVGREYFSWLGGCGRSPGAGPSDVVADGSTCRGDFLDYIAPGKSKNRKKIQQPTIRLTFTGSIIAYLINYQILLIN